MKKFLLILGLLVIIAIPIVIYFVYDFDSDANIPSDNLDTNEPEKTDKITKMLDNMSVEEKVGQMFMVRVPKENADKRVRESGNIILVAILCLEEILITKLKKKS